MQHKGAPNGSLERKCNELGYKLANGHAAYCRRLWLRPGDCHARHGRLLYRRLFDKVQQTDQIMMNSLYCLVFAIEDLSWVHLPKWIQTRLDSSHDLNRHIANLLPKKLLLPKSNAMLALGIIVRYVCLQLDCIAYRACSLHLNRS
jgi:hypothetical protein